MDVYPTEPPPEDDPLRRHPKVLVTPHLGASTKEAQEAVSVDAAIAAVTYLRGEGIKGAVNVTGLRVDLDPQQQAFVNLASRMAIILSPMITRGIANVEIELSGKNLSAASGAVERAALVGLLRKYLDMPLNLINVKSAAESRGIKLRTLCCEEAPAGGPQLSLIVRGPEGSVDEGTHPADQVRRIVGRVFDDPKPRIVEINGYHMDMVPAGDMMLIQNEDRPGMIGLVGSAFGEAGVNIADMSISRRDGKDGQMTALMVLKIDTEAPESLINQLQARPGILKVAAVKLPGDDT